MKKKKKKKKAKSETVQKAESAVKQAKSEVAWAASCQNHKEIMAAINLAWPSLVVDPSKLDADPLLLNVHNGTINLRTGKLRPHSRGDLITKLAPVDFDPKAKAPRWLAFLDETFGGDHELIGTVRRLLGYALTGLTTEETAAFFHGSGANGKSTLLTTVQYIMGDYAATVSPELVVPKRSSGNALDSQRARLRGVRLALCAESSSTEHLDDGLLKELTSNERVTARHLRGEAFQFTPTHQLVIAMNNTPRVTTNDHGTWRRLLMIPFDHTIPEAQRNENLGQQLRDEEASGILTWLVKGCLEWQKAGLAPCAAVRLATDEYQEDEDIIGGFISSCCTKCEGGAMEASVIHSAYQGWCEGQGIRPLGKVRFGKELKQRLKHERRKTGVFYLGVVSAVEDKDTSSVANPPSDLDLLN